MSKKSNNLKCPYCNRECTADKDEYTVTRRGTKQYFHLKCYEKNKIKVEVCK